MANFVKSKLGQILLDEGKVTLSDLESAIAIQKSEGKKMSQVLVEKEIVSEESMVDAISKEIGVEKIDLAEVKIDKKVLKLVSQNLCKKYNLIPFEIDGKKIKVALADPLNIFAIDDVRIVTGMKVETYIATKTQINKCIEVNYSKQQLNKAAEDLLKETMSSKNQDADVEELDDVKNAPVVKMVDQIFKNAIEMRTSDIHIEPYEDEIRIRYRIDGKLHLINTLSIESLAPLVTRIKILANLNIAEKRIPQDGKIITRVDGTDVDLRVSILPIVNGEKIVIRILKREGYTTDKKKLGMNEENIRLRAHDPEELAHYSNGTSDIEYHFSEPIGWGELWGIADRTDYDLSKHQEHSGQDLSYLDPTTNEKYVPYCIEPSLGADRVALAFLCNSYEEEEIAEGDTRTVLHLHPALAPYKVAVLPLSKKLSDKAQEVYEQLSKKFMCEYDEAGSIGKRYRREDEIGTPYCVTIDFDTLEDECVTIRDRDTMEQVRVNIDELEKWISEKVEF